MRKSDMLQIGKAGEYLVCADLILKGFISYPSEQGLPYDVLLDTGKKLLKVQVKTTEGLRIVPQRNKETKCYIFNIKRHGKGNKQRYSSKEIDLFALVCLDTMKIAYLTNTEMPDTINLRAEELRGTYYDEKGIKDYEVVKGYIDAGYTTSYISHHTDVNPSTVSRMRKSSYNPHKTNAKYFTDFIREKDWFYGI